MSLTVVEFKPQHATVSEGLRSLADAIDEGAFGDATHLAWVLDTGSGVDVGLLGNTSEDGAVAHLLLAIGQRTLEGMSST